MAARDALVYVCGDANLVEGSSEKGAALREMLLAELAVYWSTRTHGYPAKSDGGHYQESSDHSQAISRSHAFVFIYSRKTISESFYLEQYGTAKAHCVPVIGIRLTNYFMPSHLPEQYYFTEIANSAGNRNETLAGALISDFKAAMVYARDFHKSCVERLRNKIAHVCSKKLRERHFFAAMKERTPENEPAKASRVAVKCPKCGFFVRSVTPKLQRASSTGALYRRREDGGGEQNAAPRQLTSARRQKQSLPVTMQMLSPFITKKVPLLTKTANENPKSALELVRIPSTAAKPTSAEKRRDDARAEKVGDGTPTISGADKLKSLRKQSRVMGNTWTDKLRNRLRRQSSLPVIPTTYLVTTPDGLEKQVSLVKYPPEKLSPSASPRGNDGIPFFSEDEELEIIHISRVPSPDAPST